MPRTALPLIAIVLLSSLTLGARARGEDGPDKLRLDRRSDPQYMAADSSGHDAASRPAVASTSKPVTRRLPVWITKRPERPAVSAAHLSQEKAIPIPPATPRVTGTKPTPPDRAAATRGNISSVVASSLAIVLGLFFLVVWVARRAMPKASAAIPAEVLEMLGRSPLASRHNLHLMRLGKRLLLVSITPNGAETLTEITDTDEVNHLVGLCRESQPGSIAGTFRQVLHQLGTQPSRGRAARRGAEDQEFASTPQLHHR